MKLQRTTLGLLVTALVLGGGVYFYEAHWSPRQTAQSTSPQRLFAFEETDVQAFTVDTPTQTLILERAPVTAENQNTPDSSPPSQSPGPWQLVAPVKGPADSPAVSYLLSLLATARSDRTLTIPRDRLNEFGLDQPQATVDVQLANQKTHRLVLGQPDFNRRFIYAQVDPPANSPAELQILLVPMDLQTAVNRPVAEWRQQPPAPTPTPTPTPTPAPNSNNP